MTNSTNNNSNTALKFLTFVMLALVVTGLGFGIFAFTEENGLFALASSVSLGSLMLGCIRILN